MTSHSQIPALPEGCEPRCPACPHRNWTPHQSETQKNTWLHSQLSPWQDHLRPVLSPEPQKRWGYRAKTVLRARWSPELSRWEFGVMNRDRQLIPIPRCPVHTPAIQNALQQWAQEIPADLPLAFVAMVGGQCTWVLKEKHNTARRLQPSLPEGVDGLWLNFSPSAGERVFSHRRGDWLLLAGKPSSEIRLLNRTFTHGPTSFVQLIPDLYEKSLQLAQHFLAPTPQHRVIDLYSGIGVSLALWKSTGAQTIGVELHGESHQHALIHAAPFPCLRGRAEDRLAELLSTSPLTSSTHRPLLYVNPPRGGLSPAVRQWIVESCKPQKMAYLSCHAKTLSQDLQYLTQSSPLRVRSLQPFDFFPQTKQVETLALLG